MQQILHFQSGQVYEIVYKDMFTGKFISSDELHDRQGTSDKHHKFLIYITSKQVYINDELHTLTIIKDITFGVLFEQLKAQQNLRSIVKTTLRKKIGVPLQVVISSCQNILNSDSPLLDAQVNQEIPIRDNLQAMILQCRSVVFKLNDMSDWQAIQLGNFRRKNICFSLEKVIQDIHSFMTSKTCLKINLYANFDSQLHLGDIVPIQTCLGAMDATPQFRAEHPLLAQFSDQGNLTLPKSAIGDPDRLQQVCVNLIQNAIDHSLDGQIDIHLSYEWTRQQLILSVTDHGQGINL